MEILIKNTEAILGDKISLIQRGILISALLVRDKNPKMTLAKLKTVVSFNAEVKDNLLELHEAGVIRWSGFISYSKTKANKTQSPAIIEVIDFMNELYGRKFSSSSDVTTKGLRNRLEDNSVEDIKKVVSNRWEVWKDDLEMSKHLNPGTIFRPSKFEKYLEEALRTKEGARLVEAQRMNLNEGDELMFSHIDGVVFSDTYKVKTYSLNSAGARVGSGVVSKVTGKTLKSILTIQNNAKKFGSLKDKEYIYQN